MFQEKEASDFDDLEFEEREKEAGVIARNLGGDGGLGGRKMGEAKEEKSHGGGGGDLDFDDLEF